MSIRTLLGWLLLLLPLSGRAQESVVMDSLTLESTLLREKKGYAVYLPKGYSTSQRRYPVLYLFHGAGSTPSSWIQEGELQRITDTEIEQGRVTPLIIVMPDAGLTYGVNRKDGTYPYEDYFIREFMPYIERTYRCRPGKKYTAVAGLSMGGFGALLYALHHPDRFGASAALSAAVRTDEEIKAMPAAEFARRYGGVLGQIDAREPRITTFWNQNSPLFLVNQLPEAQRRAVRFYIEIGDDDDRYRGNSALHDLMRARAIPHEYRVRDGAHDWDYWRSGLPAVLGFVSTGFRQK
jgi:enterochelin esterase-like enzyme